MNAVRALAFVAAVVATVACGGGKDTPADLTASQVLERALERLADVRTLHFRLTHENGSTELPLNLRLITAEGDVQVPDRLSAEIEAKQGPITVRVRAIAIGNRAWITNPFTRQWQRLPGAVSIRDVADPTALVSAALHDLRDARIEGLERADGTLAYRVSGRVDSALLRPAIATAGAGYDVGVEVWVGTEDFLPRKVRLKGPVSADEDRNIVRELHLSRFNAPVEIRPPE